MERTNKKPHLNVAAGVIWRRGKILIAKRPQGYPLEGLWEFPGGKQEKGETLKDCLEREIAEELGIKIDIEGALMTVYHEYDSRSVSLHVYNCSHVGGEARALEGQEIRWVYPDELETFTFPPPDIKVIEFISRPDKTGILSAQPLHASE